VEGRSPGEVSALSSKALSKVAISDQAKHIPISVYLKFMEPTAFYFEHTMTLRDFEKLLVDEDPALKTGLEFYVSDGEKDVMITDKSQNFLHLLQYENLKIKSGSTRISYEVCTQ
jgi:hypothetical protein